MQEYLPVISVVVGAIIGFFPNFLNERAKEKRRLATRWDETLHETCSSFTVACRRTVTLARKVAAGDDSAETGGALDESYSRVQELHEELYLLARPPVQESSRKILRRLYAVRAVSRGEVDKRAGEYPQSSAEKEFWKELRIFYRATRMQLKVPDPTEIAELSD